MTAIGYDAESGVAVHLDDIFLSAPPLAEATFYDLDRVEVLRGPQSTLYGRGATGGSVNIITAKPDLSEFGAQGEVSYGNYNATEVKANVNIPIVTDELAVRLSGDWNRRDGFVTNLATGGDLDDRDQYSYRASVRWPAARRHDDRQSSARSARKTTAACAGRSSSARPIRPARWAVCPDSATPPASST